jgi:hypothetical protein
MTADGACVSFIGPELKGRDKWLGGELGADGNIYGGAHRSTDDTSARS